MNELPKLPSPFVAPPQSSRDYFTAEQMRAYGAECRRQALEEAAQACDAEASIEGIAQRCAAAIRGMM